MTQSGKILSGKFHPAILALASIAGFVLLWDFAALVSQSSNLPTPWMVVEFILKEAFGGELLPHIGATLARVAAAFLISIIIGTAIGLFLGLSRLADRVFDPWLALFLNIPALAIIALAYIWLGFNEAAAIGAVALNSIPKVVIVMREGARALNPDYFELARAYHLSVLSKLHHVILPQLQPFLAAASRSGVALIWKIMLVAELLGCSSGVGVQIHLYFQLSDATAVLGYAFAFMAAMLLIEMALLQPYERRAQRWGGRHA